MIPDSKIEHVCSSITGEPSVHNIFNRQMGLLKPYLSRDVDAIQCGQLRNPE